MVLLQTKKGLPRLVRQHRSHERAIVAQMERLMECWDAVERSPLSQQERLRAQLQALREELRVSIAVARCFRGPLFRVDLTDQSSFAAMRAPLQCWEAS